MNYNFHQSLDDKCHRMLNAVEPGTEVPIHRHPTKDESFVILRGKVRSTTYNDDGSIMIVLSLAKKTGCMELTSLKVYGTNLSRLSLIVLYLSVKRGRLCHTRRMAYLNCRNHGTNEPLCYGNGQENAERDLGVLCVCVHSSEEAKGLL